MLERERALLLDARKGRHAARELGLAVRRDERADLLDLLVGRGRIPPAHRREVGRGGRAQLDELEQPVHGVADLGRGETALPRPPRDPPLAESGDPLRVEAVRAAVEEGERAVGEPPNLMQRRRRHRFERRQLDPARRRLGRKLAEERELAVPVHRDGRLLRHSRQVPVDADEKPRAAALELDRLVPRRRELLVRVQAPQHPPDRRLALAPRLGVDRTRDDQAVDRARHRDVVEAEPLRPLLLLLRLPNLLVGEHRPADARRRVDDLEPEAAVRERDDLVGRGRSLVATCVGHDHDLELETLGCVDRQEPDGVRALLLGDRLQLARPERLLLADEAHEALHVRPS